MIIIDQLNYEFIDKLDKIDLYYWSDEIIPYRPDLQESTKEKCKLPDTDGVIFLITKTIPEEYPVDAVFIIYCTGDSYDIEPNEWASYILYHKDFGGYIMSNKHNITKVHDITRYDINSIDDLIDMYSIFTYYYKQYLKIDRDKTLVLKGECQICLEYNILTMRQHSSDPLDICRSSSICVKCMEKIRECPYTRKDIIEYHILEYDDNSMMSEYSISDYILDFKKIYYSAILNKKILGEESLESISSEINFLERVYKEIFNGDICEDIQEAIKLNNLIPSISEYAYLLIIHFKIDIDENILIDLIYYTYMRKFSTNYKDIHIGYIKYHYTNDVYHNINIDINEDLRKKVTDKINDSLNIKEDFLRPQKLDHIFDCNFIGFTTFCCICKKKYITDELLKDNGSIIDIKYKLHAIHKNHITTHKEYELITKTEMLYRDSITNINGTCYIVAEDLKKLKSIYTDKAIYIDFSKSADEINKYIDETFNYY